MRATGKSVTGVDDRNHRKPMGPDDNAQVILAGFPWPGVAGSARSRGPLLQSRVLPGELKVLREAHLILTKIENFLL